MSKVFRHQALLCAVLLAICVIASWPFAETGMHDDWSYVRTAQVLATTGHVVFNGWGAPLLGVELLPAAVLIKLFGFSFTIARLTTIVVGLFTTALLQRTLVRCGLREFNASVGTITLMMSPVCLPLVTGFLSDVWCLFAIVLCLYCCLRTLSAPSDVQASAWICLAALGNAIVGTSRQIAWLGLLVMVPCTLWFCRRRGKMLVAGILAFALGCGIVLSSMTWFARHPYTLPENFDLSTWRIPLHFPSVFFRPAFEIPMLVLPVLLPFVPMLPRTGRRGKLIAAAGFLLLCAWAIRAHHRHIAQDWYAPFIIEKGSILGPNGVYKEAPVWGVRPPAMPQWLRAGVSAATCVGTCCWLAVTFGRWRSHAPAQEGEAVSWRALISLLGPFALAYIFLLLPRGFRDLTIDRYLLPLVMVALIFLLREYQDRVRPDLPKGALVLAILIAGWSAVTLQDAFAMYRAVVTAGDELMAAGLPRSHFDGGWEYDGLTQIEEGGYVHQNDIRMPAGQVLLFGHRRRGPCEIPIDVWIPNVEPAYALSYDRNGCGGSTPFAPVTYKRLLWPHLITLYIVKDPDLSGKSGLFPSF